MEQERRPARPMPERFTSAAMKGGFDRAFAEIQSAPDPVKKREEFMERTRATAASFFRGHEDLVAPVIEKMDAMLAAGDPAFAETISGELSAVFAQLYADPESAERFHANLRQAEREDRARIVEASHGASLSPERMLYGNFDDGDDSVFRLHVAVATTLGPGELLGEFRKGMRELARLAGHDPAFANLREVIGTSWLVARSENLAGMLGFHVDDAPLPAEVAVHFGGETRPIKRCWMSREELMAKYGEK